MALFKKSFSKAASFDQVQVMVTRRLPIPDLEGTDKTIQFEARRGKDGRWVISSKNSLKVVTAGLEKAALAYNNALLKHVGSTPPTGHYYAHNFDTAYLILRDIEETLLRYSSTAPEAEPPGHFNAAYRLLPKPFRDGLDELLALRTEKIGILLKPKAPSPLLGAPEKSKENKGPPVN